MQTPRQPKTECPHCTHWDSKVMQSWSHPAGYTRRRKCRKCRRTFQTREVVIIAKKRRDPLDVAIQNP